MLLICPAQVQNLNCSEILICFELTIALLSHSHSVPLPYNCHPLWKFTPSGSLAYLSTPLCSMYTPCYLHLPNAIHVLTQCCVHAFSISYQLWHYYLCHVPELRVTNSLQCCAEVLKHDIVCRLEIYYASICRNINTPIPLQQECTTNPQCRPLFPNRKGS